MCNFYLENLKKHNEKCNFCYFEGIIHRHHIIPLGKGGIDEEDNIIGLCPNHHSMIHTKQYYLLYNLGHLYLIRHLDNIVIKPKKEELDFVRPTPINSIKTISALGTFSVSRE